MKRNIKLKLRIYLKPILIATTLTVVAAILVFPLYNIYESNTVQWALYNNGNFKSEHSNEMFWGSDRRIATKGVDIGISNGISKILTRRSVIIALIDGDFDVKSKNIDTKKIWSNSKEIQNGKDDDENGYVDDVNGWNFRDNTNKLFDTKNESSHGMSILFQLVGNKPFYNGVLDRCNCSSKIMPIKVLSDSDKGRISDLIKAIEYAEDNGANICQLSLNTNINDSKLKSVMKNSKMLFVVSAGNNGWKLDGRNKVYPVSYMLNNVISVAAIRCDGKLNKISNYGNNVVDIAAPGTDIASIDCDGQLSYYSGTTYSAIYVSAAAAILYCSSRVKYNAVDLKRVIMKTSKKTRCLSGLVKCNGMININNILQNK